METATKDLENDHVYILRLIDVMEQMVLSVSTEIVHIEMAVNLIRKYADGYHHAKEEHLLFPLLVKKGLSNDHGPIAVLLQEHAGGRKFVKGMEDEISNIQQGDESSLTVLYENMQGYIDLMRAHIIKENKVLFPLADKTLSPVEQQTLLRAFADLERANYTHAQLQRFVTDIVGLEAVYTG